MGIFNNHVQNNLILNVIQPWHFELLPSFFYRILCINRKLILKINKNNNISSQAKSNQIKSNQVKSSQVKSSQVKSSQVKSSQVKSSQIMDCECLSACIEQPSPSGERISKLCGQMLLTALYFFLIGLALTKIFSSWRKNKKIKMPNSYSFTSSSTREVNQCLETLITVPEHACNMQNSTRFRSNNSLNNATG